MPPRNDIIWRIANGIRWDESLWVDACKIDYIDELIDKVNEIRFKKEKKMNKLQGRNIDKIEIRRYGDNVVAKAYARANITDCSGYMYDQGWSLVGEASAKCGPNDIFDFNIGAKLAMDRLYEGYDMTPKPKRKPYNGLIRVVWNEDSFDAFKVVDGKLYSDIYVLRLPCQQEYTIYEDSPFEEMKQALLNSASFFWCDKRPPMAICRDHVTDYL